MDKFLIVRLGSGYVNEPIDDGPIALLKNLVFELFKPPAACEAVLCSGPGSPSLADELTS